MTQEIKEQIQDSKLADALSERYLAYAMSTIVSRSLPDVRDGLKPVHRRLLFAMRHLKLDPKAGFKKCARVVGDVIGKYHPHGDVAVYEAMVRLAQDFAVRYPLVEGQGNFGNIDGDRAAAMRYTEARLTNVALLLMDGLDDNAVDFSPTYDGSEDEPVVMPAAFPNLLANGSSGIAVGMATNIPPHNVHELCQALQYLIKNPDAEVEKLVDFIHGPDFPTGGLLMEDKTSIVRAYETGQGAFRVRSKWEKEDLSHGQYQIVVTQIPYAVPKSDLIARIAKLLLDKKLPLLADIRDESDENVRIVIEPKNRTVAPELLMEHLFQRTDLQSTFHLNMNVLDADSTPKVMSIKQVLQAFLNHRHIVLKRRALYRLDKIKYRMELLKGFLITYLNLDRVIALIRGEDEPKPLLMQEFKLSDIQVEAILNMKLRSLRKLEEMQIKDEFNDLDKQRQELEKLLQDEPLRWQAIHQQIEEVKKMFGSKTALGERRTIVVNTPVAMDVPAESLIEKEPITVVLSNKAWLRALKGHVNVDDIRFKEEDSIAFFVYAQTTDKILFFASNGLFYTIMGDKITGGRGFGAPIRLIIDLPENENIVAMFIFDEKQNLIVASASGKGFQVKMTDVVAQTRSGKIVLNLAEKDVATLCVPVVGDKVAVMGQNRKLLIFDIQELPTMTRGQGVILQKYQGSKIADIETFKKEDGFPFAFGNGVRIERNLTAWVGKRASVGKLPPVGFPRNNRFK